LQLIANNEDFSKQVSTIFIEADDVLFKQLQERVGTFYETHPNIRKPIYRYGIFSEVINQILSAVKGTLPPTFLFVDPCGVSGTSFSAISSVMEHDKCEVFIFFNIDGVRRIAGLPALSPVLVDLMGSERRARTLHRKLRTTGNVWQREEIILSEYCEALTDDMGISYIIPFRVEHENQRKASHYLIHATRHPLGFSIMKDVMWRRGRGEDHVGGLEFR
jgi:three-Cys-motif partner protein